ncbi:amino acid ABC transporter ATP-binding protein [Bradyrhizobium sp. U87765 SZCCT0131]|uniref:amino acid ABC transporter ATP-binding protein n=1 Tax=unclassified Bradyrhizobium TaxID=2631580 RepID=UPI001BA5F6F4|nr:amino acid ABC transporter ATP-binding protein [Bradyrhizobium sp. U87765 SZCCT0131]MBR1264518.1 amino acid ABC transporter ATP-binding protein [Bradyrhizobium sp. U87765 SZCCT0134]MBR1304575.1 amino acid ABC transporter ATP-binding protein [Bradyrhizobium sp. U87765 SZCCT0110]MBR1322568.1 amino acid ABC transporter ATP-binding protein [Bradyrhizobium sp. U87765 SZCCT0109]MBR1346504.1 amino acid ABC transporter ATP-binding protein [Bradyrhizobium sp. U87765 SZCCT0048]
MLEARGLRKRFGAVEVLRGVDLLVERGRLVFLIGPSGSGKSTLLRCCNRLEEPDAGAIIFDGVDLLSRRTDINAARRQIGMVFQHFNLYPHLTVLGNVTLALRKVVGLRRQEAEVRAMAALELVGLAEKAPVYPAQLSGGQQQRIAIARTLALDPKIILMDEPTSALDPELVGSVLAVIKDLRARGITMVIASHEMSFARSAADRVLFVDGGVVVEEGDAEEIFARPRHERTRRFLTQIRH